MNSKETKPWVVNTGLNLRNEDFEAEGWFKGRVTIPDGYMLCYEHRDIKDLDPQQYRGIELYLTDRSTPWEPAPRTYLGYIMECRHPHCFTVTFPRGGAVGVHTFRMALDELLTYWNIDQWYHLPLDQQPSKHLRAGDAQLIREAVKAGEARRVDLYEKGNPVGLRVEINLQTVRDLKALTPEEKWELYRITKSQGILQPGPGGQVRGTIKMLWGLSLLRRVEPREGLNWYYVPQDVQDAVESLRSRRAALHGSSRQLTM